MQKPHASTTPPTLDDVRSVSPALARYTQDRLLGELWKRPGLSPRDRSIVTVSALIARNQVVEMPFYFNLALDNGVKPGELSEIITHLAFYSGWANATSAVAVAQDVFARRGIAAEQLPPASPELLPLDEVAEAQRAASVANNFGAVSPGVVHYTGELLFRELWRRPGLAARDRSLVTVSALVATGQVAQVTYHRRSKRTSRYRRPPSAVGMPVSTDADWLDERRAGVNTSAPVSVTAII